MQSQPQPTPPYQQGYMITQTEPDHLQVVVAAVKALTEYLQVRRALAPHSFPLDRHESEGPSG
eukprot:2543239-Rhodomonas_salina.1